MQYQREGVPLVIFAGKEYGSGSSRDWAAKGTQLLGVRAVIAESFERIHRSNLVNMGVLPLQFKAGVHGGVAGADRPRAGDDRRPRRRSRSRAATSRCKRDRGRRHGDRVRDDAAHRHAGGARRLLARRHPAVRAASAGQELIAQAHGAREQARSCRRARPRSRSNTMSLDCRRGEGAGARAGVRPLRRRGGRRLSRARVLRSSGSRAATPARWTTWRARPSAAATCATSCPRRGRSSSPRPTTTPIGRTRPTSTIAGVAKISRYAWGDDYHDVIGRRLDALVDVDARRRSGTPFEAQAVRRHRPGAGARLRAVRRPRLDREEHLSHQRQARVVAVPLRHRRAACRSRPTRRRPTTAAPARAASTRVPPMRSSSRGVLDARRCLSYLTIELRGRVPDEFRARDGQPRLRLRHLPGRLSVEPVAAGLERSGLAAAAGVRRRPVDRRLRRGPMMSCARVCRGSPMKRAKIAGLASQSRRSRSEPAAHAPRGARLMTTNAGD